MKQFYGADVLLERPKSLSELAADQIRARVIDGTFGLGTSLSEAHLTSALGISKTPIREALAVLGLQGIVELIPNKGAFVFSLTRKDIIELCSYRYTLEAAAYDLTVKENPQQLIDDLERICAQMESCLSSNDFAGYLALDTQFHDALFENCGNTFLLKGYQGVHDIVATIRTHLSTPPERTTKSLIEHQRILAFTRDRQWVKAKSVLRKQITRGERSYADLTGAAEVGLSKERVRAA